MPRKTINNHQVSDVVPDVNFSQACKSTSNGKQRITHIIKGRSFQYLAWVSRTRASMLFDLHCGNHNLSEEAQRKISDAYQAYRSREKFRPRGYTSVTHKCVQLEIKREHADDWWLKVWRTFCELKNLQRIRMKEPFDLTSHFTFPKELLRVLARHSDGELVEVDPDKLREISETLSLNFERVRTLKPRQMEMLVAAIYSSTGYFDRVILTRATRDQGRDVILERDAWNGRRFLIEVKAYSPKRSTPPDKIDGILGVADGEALGSCVALFSTSYFSSEIEKRPNVKNTIRKKLQLVDFVGLVEASIQASYSNCPDVLSELRRMTIERQLNES